jgi:hypothetical protein
MSTSEIFTTVFYAFLRLVTVGCGHGLILLPVFSQHWIRRPGRRNEVMLLRRAVRKGLSAVEVKLAYACMVHL